MNGPEHYRKAEDLMAIAERQRTAPTEQIRLLVEYAGVHAELAKVAAHVDGLGSMANNDEAWHSAVG